MAASLIVGESYRASRSTAKRRDDVDEALDALRGEVGELRKVLEDKLGAHALQQAGDGTASTVETRSVADQGKEAARVVLAKESER